ncbi:MAG: NAD(P)H-dependent oxidoreductase [Clostridia bacterium]|nr:NAD(P)H-dependent oxidoreductase [Clostridia bacterium]
MKSIFIYYSLSGNGDLVASSLSDKGIDIRPVRLKKPMPKAFFLQIMKGGFLAGTGNRAKLDGFDPDVSGYDRVVIGSPIWNGRIVPAINTVLDTVDLAGKEVVFILTSGGGSAPKAEERLKSSFPGARIIMLKQPKNNEDELSKLDF